MTFAHYLTKMRLGHAANLLKHSQQEILDITFSCGFGSVSRFYEAFKKEFNASPAEYRQQF